MGGLLLWQTEKTTLQTETNAWGKEKLFFPGNGLKRVLWVKIRQSLSKNFYNPDIQTVIKIQKRSIMKMTRTFKVL